ncbi:glycosyltransferase family 2 protein [Pedobacter sp. G11]|uniref:glycosyltransferase family 2 protein n=1 Tax=Pedobacter sp. G11 TaxID=2482728 RepID=UPI000F5F9A35|nr:glycosyltransferase family A protein [Pedobacter sp. G11]AZI25274.1 glycosyltransferase family 2 protein [Pedobacter sp. G11]
MISVAVSIIIPTYNYAHLITQTLTCLVNQHFTDWEAIIIDDGSTDETEKVVEKFIKNDNRFLYLKQPNRGVSAARNQGIKFSKGKYIQFLDADDLISQDKIVLQYNVLEQHEDTDISYVKTKYFDSGRSDILYDNFDKSDSSQATYFNGSGYEIIKQYIINNQTVVQSPLFRREIFDKVRYFREEMHYLEDWDFWLRCAFGELKFSFLENKDAFSLVRIHLQSASKQSTKIIEAEGKLRDLINQYLAKSSLHKQEKMELEQLNNKLLVVTFKYLMAKTPYTAFSKFRNYYQSINNKSLFFAALLKSFNLKRKS